MKKIHFLFQNDKSVIYDEDVLALENEYYTFMIGKQKFKVKLENNFHFIKEDEDSIFEIRSEEKNYATFTLKEKNIKVDVDMDNFEYKKNGNKYIVKYALVSDEGQEKVIIFELS